jgi:hypothetical protein
MKGTFLYKAVGKQSRRQKIAKLARPRTALWRRLLCIRSSQSLKALEHPNVIALLMEYAGLHQWLFLGRVCKAWAALLAPPGPSRRSRGPTARTLQRSNTSFAAAATSLQRTLFADRCDETLLQEEKLLQLSKAAARLCCTDVLTLARTVSAGRWRGWSHELCTAAADGNQIAVLQMLQSDAEVLFDAVKLAAVAAGCKSVQLSTLQWICDQHDTWNAANVVTLCLNAAAADATDELDWLSKNMSCCSEALRASRIVEAGVQAGSLNALRWLVKAGVQLNNMKYTDCASTAAQFAVLRYLVSELRCPWNQQLARERAAAAGTVDDKQWIADADSSFWTVAELSKLLVTAGQHDNLTAAMA